MRPYDYYLFDADGTLLDTADLIVACFRNTCARLGGFDIPRERVIARMGLTLRAQLAEYLGLQDEGRLEEAARFHMAHQMTIYPDYLRTFPGVAETLAALTDRGARCAVVTSRMPESLALYLDHTGLSRYFQALITPRDTREHKPRPEPALAALSRLGAPAGAPALMVGDASFDIECGAAAGLDTAFAAWSHSPVSACAVTPTYVIQRMGDLLA